MQICKQAVKFNKKSFILFSQMESRIGSINNQLQRDEKVLYFYYIILEYPILVEYCDQLICSKLANKIINRAIEENSLKLNSIEQEVQYEIDNYYQKGKNGI